MRRFTFATLRAACAIADLALIHQVSAAQELIYDLDWNGPATSYVEECFGSGSCYQYPIDGRIGLTLGNRPQLRNIDSSIRLAPSPAPANPASEFTWEHMNVQFGVYKSDPNAVDLVIDFIPHPVADFSVPVFPLQLALTQDRTALTITGEGALFATTENEVPSISFAVSGRLVPEPNAVLLALLAAIACGSNRARR